MLVLICMKKKTILLLYGSDPDLKCSGTVCTVKVGIEVPDANTKYTLFVGIITLLLLWQTMEIPFHRIQPGNILVQDVFGSEYSGKTWLADSKCHLTHRSRIFSFHKTQPTLCIVEFLSPSICLCRNSLESIEIWKKIY